MSPKAANSVIRGIVFVLPMVKLPRQYRYQPPKILCSCSILLLLLLLFSVFFALIVVDVVSFRVCVFFLPKEVKLQQMYVYII